MAYTDMDRERDFEYFWKNLKFLYDKYGNRAVAIQHQKVIGVYDTVVEGIHETEKITPRFTFIVQKLAADKRDLTVKVSPVRF